MSDVIKEEDNLRHGLDQAALVSLVKQGKESWNAWAGANPESTIDFSNMTFEDRVSFVGFQFPGDAVFHGATFTGAAWFREATFTAKALFSEATFTGDAVYGSIDVQVRIDFNSSLFYNIPDFQTAKNRDRVLVDNVVFTLPRPAGLVPKIIFWLTGIRGLYPSVIARIRQLRGIANDTHAIDAERDLTILERNAEVGVAWSGLKELRPFWQWAHSVLATFFRTPLLVLYRWTSDYGRSIKLPLFWLVTTPFVWFAVHFKLYLVYGIPGRYLLSDEEFSAIKSITLFGAFPISATQRPAYTTAVETLSGGSSSAGLPFALQVSLTLQSVTSLVFLFLIGLALRNFFRMK